MNEHAGLGSLLSVLIVVGFTLILHEAEQHPTPPLARREVISPAKRAVGPGALAPEPVGSPADHVAAVASASLSGSPAPAPADASIALIDRPQPTRVPSSDPVVGRSSPRPTLQTISVRSSSPALAPVAQSQSILAPPTLPSPTPARSTITVSTRGERLVDIALRVYGRADAVELLWRANRDRLAQVDAPITEGWLLRTP